MEAGTDNELEAEQAHVDHAYACLEKSRKTALELTAMVEVGEGGTNQARYEREVINETIAGRLQQLDLGDAALVFGRIDQAPDAGGGRYHIGRLGVWDEDQEPVVVDWRAPVSEPFYRATGPQPLGLERRRHFTSRGRTVLAIEDEFFGDLSRLDGEGGRNISGEGALVAALEASRTGRLGDIVATIQGEQDAVIRSELPGIIVVQGGPGTGKTVVALHRAAYLLYTHRFPLAGQGVLVVGPNRLFLAYIEQVLPSLGEAGVHLSTIGDLVPHVSVGGRDSEAIARVKGDLRMIRFVAEAVKTRQRPLRSDLIVGFGLEHLRCTVAQSETIVSQARRRYRTHNGGRKFVEAELFLRLAESSRESLDPAGLAEKLRGTEMLREALEWMWPVLTPPQLLFDLFGSKALIRAAAGSQLSEAEIELLHRQRLGDADDVSWTTSDAPMLDEARALLGPRPKHKEVDTIRTYGHIVIDEAQDLSPMELRVLDRRSLNGSMTIVGDIAQSTGAWAHDDWDSVLEHLPAKREPRRTELTIGYRIPAPAMALAAKVLTFAAPGLKPPIAVREEGDVPTIEQVADLGAGVVEEARDALAIDETGNVAVIVPNSLVDAAVAALADAGLDFGRATRRGLEQRLTVVPVSLVKGLEVDVAIVVEPQRIIDEELQGVRSLYVALTRATKQVRVVHHEALPAYLKPL